MYKHLQNIVIHGMFALSLGPELSVIPVDPSAVLALYCFVLGS